MTWIVESYFQDAFLAYGISDYLQSLCSKYTMQDDNKHWKKLLLLAIDWRVAGVLSSDFG